MWLPCNGNLCDIDFHKKLPIIALFLRIRYMYISICPTFRRFFASNILRIYPVESVFQYFLYGVSSLAKVSLMKYFSSIT